MIQIQPIVVTDLKTMKIAIEKIAREAMAMQNPTGQEDAIYVNTVPTVANTREGQIVWYDDGVNRRIYTKLGGVIRFATLT
ncbi:MAG: hypothetical protein V1709_04320 [Planctomycetota bacterium]